jgi:glycogen(starch) synthase
VVGRTLTYNHVDFYSTIETAEADLLAERWQVKDKHQLERAAAVSADIFTTVSEITDLEACYFLKRQADVLTYNGLDLEKLHSIDELIFKKGFQRNKLKNFLLYYFFPYYSFDLEETLFYFISGRYEYKAKGVDIFIKALGQLNQHLIEKKTKKTIVVFFWILAGVRNIELELLENREFFQHIEELVKQATVEIDKKILFSLIEKGKFNEKILLPKDVLFEFKKRCLKFKKQGQPLISTHLLEDQNDPIITALKEANLNNYETDRVKVVFYPIYLTGHDGLLNLNYQEAIQGCDLGVFPSSYEPWGYTPLETAVSGICTVTTDLTGFGRYIEKNFKLGNKNSGIFILKRFHKEEKEEIEQLTDFLYQFTLLDKHQLVFCKNQARNLAMRADWRFFIRNYVEAYNLALKKKIEREKED